MSKLGAAWSIEVSRRLRLKKKESGWKVSYLPKFKKHSNFVHVTTRTNENI